MKRWFFTHPTMHGMDIDDPRLTSIRRDILRQKIFLGKLYQDWYALIENNLGISGSRIIELGSGAGLLEKKIPHVLKTDVFHHAFIHLVIDGLRIPFPSESLNAIVLLDVFHHLPDVNKFLEESQRSLQLGGRIIMIEPWVTAWSRKAYARLHFEPIDPEMENWQFKSSGPLSGSNQALPWIVFERDKKLFHTRFPHLQIIKIQPMMPFRYILSGGFSSWLSLPGFCYPAVKWFESLFDKKMDNWGMFALIVLEKIK